MSSCSQVYQNDVTCSGPSAGVIQVEEAEVERLRLTRESVCVQGPNAQSCADLTRWYNDALSRLEALRAAWGHCH